MQTAAIGERLERGVWRVPWLSEDGHDVLVAITASGKRLRQVRLRPGVSEARVIAWLEDLLAERDPLPPARPDLRLVRPTDPARDLLAPMTTPPKPLSAEERRRIYIEEDPVRRMLDQRARAAAKGQLPRLRRFR